MIDGFLLKQLSKTKLNLGKGSQWKRFKRLLKRQLIYAALEGKREFQLEEVMLSEAERGKISDWCYRHDLDFDERTRVVSW